MLKWLHKCLCNCASVLCLLPVAACCQAEDTLTLFRMLCLLFQLLATVTHPHTHQHTHKHAHASVHCIMALSLSILLLRCTVSSVHSRPKRKNETAKKKKNTERKRQHLLQTFRRMRLPVYVCGTLMGSTAARILMDTHAN